MGLYAKYVLPRVIDIAMRNREVERLRAEWIPKARGEVLEIGIGSGLNLPFYSSEVARIHAVDPSPQLLKMARERAARTAFDLEFLSQSAEEVLPVEPGSIDTVVITWSLCSIQDPEKALEQARRVLRADGMLIFLEHGRAPDPSVRKWQDRITPCWKHGAGGCHLNREIDTLIRESGFQIAELTKDYLRGPRLLTYTYRGVAFPPDGL